MFEWFWKLFKPKTPCLHRVTRYRITTIEVPVWNPGTMQYEWIKQKIRVNQCVNCKTILETVDL